MSSYILSIDQGTTGTTILIIDRNARVVARGYEELPQIYPQPGWVEQDPEVIWQITQKAINNALSDGNVKLNEISAIGLTNQRETTILWDRDTGKPMHNAIVWQCRRTAPLCEKLRKDGYEDFFRNKTGLVLDAYFSGTKIQWLLQKNQEWYKLAQQGKLAFGTIDTWLLWKLTNGKAHSTDYTNASRTLLYNIHKKVWDDEILSLLDIPKSILPDVHPSMYHYGNARLNGYEIPITSIAGDQQASLVGQGGFYTSAIKNTYGTGCFLLINTGDKDIISKKGLLTTLACDSKGQPVYALEGSIFTTGATIQWLRDGLGLIKSADETESLARSVPDSGGVIMVPALAGLGAPHWDMNARGAFFGLTRATTKAHLVRAVLEGIAFQVWEVFELMKKEAEINPTQIMVDGGGAKNDFLLQFQADLLQIPVLRSIQIDSTALGTAFLSGLQIGFWKDEKEINELLNQERKQFLPKLSIDEVNKLTQNWLSAVARVILQPGI